MAGRELGCYGDAALLYRCQSVAVRRGMVILLPYSLREKSPAGCAKLSAGGLLSNWESDCQRFWPYCIIYLPQYELSISMYNHWKLYEDSTWSITLIFSFCLNKYPTFGLLRW